MTKRLHRGAAGLLLCLASGWGLAAEQVLRGEVVIADGPAPPPGAVMDVAIEDQARMDAPAETIAATQSVPSGDPPYPFSLAYDPDKLTPRGRYGMRVRISVDGRLWSINTRHVPAFDASGGQQDRIVTVPVEAVGAAKRPGTAFFWPLPALYTGTLACNGCVPQDHLLELDADGNYVYQIIPTPSGGESPEPAANDDIGRWSFDAAAGQLTLRGGREAPVVFRVENSHLLTRLGPTGAPIHPEGESELNRAAACTALEPRLFVAGMLQYMADAALLTECLTGQRLPVAMEGDFAALERAYLSTLRETGAEPGSPVYVTLEASLAQRPVIDGEGMRRTVVVERFTGIWPDRQCPAPR